MATSLARTVVLVGRRGDGRRGCRHLRLLACLAPGGFRSRRRNGDRLGPIDGLTKEVET